jgi:hypothetical protein
MSKRRPARSAKHTMALRIRNLIKLKLNYDPKEAPASWLYDDLQKAGWKWEPNVGWRKRGEPKPTVAATNNALLPNSSVQITVTAGSVGVMNEVVEALAKLDRHALQSNPVKDAIGNYTTTITMTITKAKVR